MFGVKIALGALTFLNALYQSYAATCTAFTSQSSCTQTTMCAWSTANGCYCNAATNLEVVFVMDSSGSVKDWGWESEKTFVKSVVNTGLSQGSYVGIVEFSDESEIKYTFNGVQKPRTTITTLVDGLPFLNGYTATLAAVKDAITIFQTTTKSLPRIMFLITDGNPNPSSSNPCSTTSNSAKTARKNLQSLNVTTLLITVGPDINAGTLSCLYNNDPSRVIAANDFTAASLEAIRAKTDAYLCPTVSDIRIGEVRVQVSLSGDPGGNSRYLEVYNHGQVIDFTGNPLKLTGFVTGTISTGTLKNGQRLVIYDNSGTAGTDMQCNSCTCAAEETNSAGSLVSNKCTNALYIACNTAGASCSFSGSMSNTHWSQKIEDTVDKVVFVDITHDSTTNNLATVPQGFTFEVIDLLKDVSTGANWKRSCLMYGTPGDKPLSTCSAICVTSICRSSGDTAATCASSSACDCTASQHYYSDQLQCSKLPPPSGCTTIVAKENDGFQYATVAWTNAGTTLEHSYIVSYTYEGASGQTSTTSSDTPFVVYGPNGINVLTDTPPTVSTVVEVNGETVQSVAVSCPFKTLAPTSSPTKKPTQLPTLRPTIQPTKKPTSPPTGKPSTPPTAAPSKRPTVKPTGHPTVSGYHITDCSIAVKAGSTSAITVTYTLSPTSINSQLGLTLELNLDNAPGRGAVSLNAANGSPQDTSISNAAGHSYYLWPRYRSYATSGPFTGFSRGASCTVTTSEPTPAPTGKPSVSPTPKPTGAPTKKPTGVPTATPTKKPTYETIQVDSCSVTLGRFDSNGEITTLTVEFTEPTLNPPVTPSSGNLAYLISWGTGEKESFGVASKGSGSEIVSSAKNILITPDATVELTPRVKNPSGKAGPSTTCTVFTLTPTVAPTKAPHAPTRSPVKPNIQLALDDERCVAGTVDDEGRDIYVCEYEVSSGAYSVGVELTTGASDFEITYQWSISFDRAIEPKFELGTDVAIAPKSDFGALEDTNTIEAEATSGEFSLLIADKADETISAEVAWLTLTACTYASDLTCSIASAETHRKTYRISIVNDKGGKQTSANSKGKMPTWIWYPVAAGILMLAGLAAFGYMYYNKRKLAEEQLQQKEADLANAEELDNMENFGGLGDNITFNPIATAGTHEVATGGEYIDKQLAKQQKHAEFAQVDVDKEVWRQDFGQIKADRHEV